MGDSILTGKLGEDMAAMHLSNKGYTILCRNYRFKKSEIDIIALGNNTLVFIEVKFRKNASYGNPEEFVTSKKEALILLGAENYIFTNGWKGKIRFDIISITNKESVVHFQDAF